MSHINFPLAALSTQHDAAWGGWPARPNSQLQSLLPNLLLQTPLNSFSARHSCILIYLFIKSKVSKGLSIYLRRYWASMFTWSAYEVLPFLQIWTNVSEVLYATTLLSVYVHLYLNINFRPGNIGQFSFAGDLHYRRVSDRHQKTTLFTRPQISLRLSQCKDLLFWP